MRSERAFFLPIGNIPAKVRRVLLRDTLEGEGPRDMPEAL